jgi:ribosome maturation protein Sdo1
MTIIFQQLFNALQPKNRTMAQTQNHPKDNGIVPNKEGTTGAQQMLYKVDNTHFIIVVDNDSMATVNEFRKHPDMKNSTKIEDPLMSALAIDEVFAEKVGDRASEQQLHAAFGTTDIKKIVKEIMINGKFH